MKGVHNGATLVVVDPRRTLTAQKAHTHLAIAIGSDIALLNAMAHVIIRDGLWDQNFVKRATTGFEEFAASVAAWTPERASLITGIASEEIERVARAYAKADRAIIGWTLGITEHHNAVDNVFALINLALLTGHVGREGCGLNPLRGQNNVQGGGDMGALPDRLPGFQDIRVDSIRARFESAWGVTISGTPGFNQTQMFEAMDRGELKGLYVIGENPVDSDANGNHVRQLLQQLDMLVVQDIFLTATAQMADVVLPAKASFAESDGTYTNSERRVQRVRSARKAPGDAQDDLWIVTHLANAMGYSWPEMSAEQVFDEMRQLAPNFHGMTYDRLTREKGIQWPCPDENHPGTRTLHTRLWEENIGTPAPFTPVDWQPPVEMPTEDFPFLLTTGRRLGFFNTGVQSEIYHHPHPGEWMEIHPDDAKGLGLTDQDTVRVTSRRGQVLVPIRISETVQPGTVFMTFHFPDLVDTNQLTIDATDPRSGTAEFKACAVRVERIDANVPRQEPRTMVNAEIQD